MKRLIVIAILLFASNANAEWTKTNTALQLTYTALHVADWGQTRWVSRNPYTFKNGQFHPVSENNIILGKRPSTDKVDIYFASTLIGHTAISYILPESYRIYWQSITVCFQAVNVTRNINIGVKMRF